MNTNDCKQVTDTITEFGATVPEPLADVIDALDATKQCEAEPEISIAALARSGEYNAKTAAGYLAKALNRPTRDLAEIKAEATAALVLRFGDLLRGDAGDQVIEAIRPAFEAATAGISAARDLGISASSTGEAVITLGDKAVQAWRGLPAHRQVLDRAYAVVTALASEWTVIGQPDGLLFRFGTAPAVGAFFAADENTNLENAARHLFGSSASSPAGKWMDLLSVTPLRLNTVTRAREILEAQTAARREAAQHDFAATHGTPTLAAGSEFPVLGAR